MFLNIIKNVPIWVWPLFILLVLLGLRSTKDRTAPVLPFYFFPLIGLMGLGRMDQFSHQSLSWPIFFSGFLFGAVAGYRLQQKWTLQRTRKTVTLAGEWFTLFVLMAIFSANFVSGMVQAVWPAVFVSFPFEVGYILVTSAVSGTFLGRTLAILKMPASNTAEGLE